MTGKYKRTEKIDNYRHPAWLSADMRRLLDAADCTIDLFLRSVKKHKTNHKKVEN